MVTNSTRGKRERIGRILRMHANKREELDEADSGNIYAAVGLRDTRTGDTLCDEAKPIILEKMIFPEPVISIAVEPKTKVDVEKLGVALQKLATEDPSFRVHTDEESGQTIISGMGELHLDIICDRLRREFKVESNVGKPEVAYREAIAKSVHCEYKYAKQSGGRGQFGHVLMEIGPGERARATCSRTTSSAASSRRSSSRPSRRASRRPWNAAFSPDSPWWTSTAASTTAATTTSYSSAAAFEIAASLCFQDGAKRAGLHLLEPVMKNEVVVPEQYMGDVIGDLNSRRGKILGMSPARKRPGHRLGSSPRDDVRLRDRPAFDDAGSGYVVTPLSHYAPVPAAVQELVVAKVRGTSS